MTSNSQGQRMLSLSQRSRNRSRRDVDLTWSAGLTVLVTWVSFFCPLSSSAQTFTATGSMATARTGHTATLLPNGKVLVAGGRSGSVLNTTELYDPTTGTFSPTGSMATGRESHTATVLPNGKVLVAGGYAPGILNTAELYDPLTGRFSPTGSMATARGDHTATLLPNGKVLVVGGITSLAARSSTAEIYDPLTGSFSPTGSMTTGRAVHTATLLPNGKVLIAGGQNSSALNTAELYDPATGSFSTTGSMTTEREAHTATLLPNGKVLIAGGSNSQFLNTAQLYDPSVGTFSPTGSMAVAREAHTATVLSNGKVLVAGGVGSGVLSSAELYDPATNSFSPTGSMAAVRMSHPATLLPNGKLLVTGGHSDSASFSSALNTAELYDASNATFAAGNSMNSAHFLHTATQLGNGKVLVASGGIAPGVLTNMAELYDPVLDSFTATGSLATARFQHTATLLPNGKVLIAGGVQSDGGIANTAELYDSTTGTFSATGNMTNSRFGHTATLLQDGKVLITGGSPSGGTVTNTAEIYDLSSGTFTAATGAMSVGRFQHSATLLHNGKVLIAGGGFIGGFATTSVDLYDPAARTFSPVPAMLTGRFSHTATLLPSGKVLIAGGNNNVSAQSSTELYDPNSGTAGAFSAGPAMNAPRFNHTATLLPTGHVMLAGGFSLFGVTITSELYNPLNGGSGAFTPPSLPALVTAVQTHTATLLTNGKVLITGGFTDVAGSSAAQLYDPGLGFTDSRRPVIGSAPTAVATSGALSLTGARFRGDSEGSSGATNNSSTGYPLVQLRRVDNDQILFMPSLFWSDTAFISGPHAGLPLGHYRITVYASGVPSLMKIVAVTAQIVDDTSLLAAVLPSSRSVQAGTPATAFATVINTGQAIATVCFIEPLTSVLASFVYQTTDPATNQVTGFPNVPANILPGAAQSFVFAFTPMADFAPTDVQMNFDCVNSAPAPIHTGLNTLLLSASNTPVPDIVALAATLSNDGIVNISGTNGTGAFAVATVNVGASGSITASADTGNATLPMVINLCETNPATGQCISTVDTSVTTTINANATPTFGIFLQGNGIVPFDPATNRIFVRFKDGGNVTRGSTSVAVRTQ